MFHARDDWSAATALAPRPGAAFGRRAEPVALTVDLTENLFSSEWWRGLGTLGLLCTAALCLAPGVEPLAGGRIATAEDSHQADALRIAPLSSGSATGLRLVETDAVEPLTSAPERTRVDLFMTLGARDSVGRLLARAGASLADAQAAEYLVRGSGSRPSAGTSVSVILGQLQTNASLARALGITGTPGFLFNKTLVPGAVTVPPVALK